MMPRILSKRWWRAARARWSRALALGLLACGALPLLGRAGPPDAPADAPVREWPTQIDGLALRPLAPSAVEQRFAAQFPGRIGRFESEAAVWVLRDVDRPTRALHPASDCFRASGYAIESARLERDAQQRLWRCFVALRAGERVRVCERIVDADGAAFTDASAWFWAAALERSHGPWLAMTRVEVP